MRIPNPFTRLWSTLRVLSYVELKINFEHDTSRRRQQEFVLTSSQHIEHCAKSDWIFLKSTTKAICSAVVYSTILQASLSLYWFWILTFHEWKALASILLLSNLVLLQIETEYHNTLLYKTTMNTSHRRKYLIETRHWPWSKS